MRRPPFFPTSFVFGYLAVPGRSASARDYTYNIIIIILWKRRNFCARLLKYVYGVHIIDTCSNNNNIIKINNPTAASQKQPL